MIRGVLLCALVCFSFAQNAPPRVVSYDFATVPAQGTFTPVNGASFTNKMLVLNQAQANTNAAMFLTSKVWVDNWKANFTFVLGAAAQHNGGFTFIIQADNIGSAGPNDAGLGYGSYTGGVGGVGYSKSLALEFDTFYDLGVDDTLAGVNCSAPHFAIHSMGSSANSAIEDQGNFAKLCFTQFNDPYKEGDKVHQVTMTYNRPVLSVYYDTTVPPILQVTYDLVGTLELSDSQAWIGFTSSTGSAGGDLHAITSMYFEYVSDLAPGNSVMFGLGGVVAGVTGTFQIQSIDQFSHPYPFGSASVNVTFVGALPGQQSFSVLDNGNGTYVVTFACTSSAVTSLDVTMNGIPIKDSPFPLQVVAAAVDSSMGQFSGANTFARAGVPSVVNLLVFDRFGNPTNASCTFENSTLSGNAGSIALENPVLTATGVWSITYTASKVGEYYWNISANGVPFANQSAPLFVSNGDVSAQNSSVNGLSASFTAGSNQTFSVAVVDSSGNPYTGAVDIFVNLTNVQSGDLATVSFLSSANGVYRYQFVITVAGLWNSLVLINGSAVSSGVPQTISVLSSTVVPSASQIVYGGTPIQYVAGTTPGLLTILQAKDQYGNLESSNEGLYWTVTVNGVAYNADPQLPTPGQFQVSWSPTVAGTYTMTALLNGVAVQNSGNYQVVVSGSSTPSVANTLFDGSGWTSAKSGEQASFTVTLRDMFNNVISGQNNVTVTISPKNNPSVQVMVGVVFASPVYSVTYTPPGSGVYLVSVYINNLVYGGGAQVINVDGPLSVGQIIGIVAGGIGAIALIIGIVILWRRKKKLYQPL